MCKSTSSKENKILGIVVCVLGPIGVIISLLLGYRVEIYVSPDPIDVEVENEVEKFLE